jgi:hypothetical protein
MDKEVVQALANRLNLTSVDLQEENILTAEEEKAAIAHAIELEMKHFAWRRMDKGQKEGDVELEMSQINWMERINTEEVLQLANSAKHRALWEKEQRIKEKREEQDRRIEFKKYWTANRMYNFMKWSAQKIFEKQFIIHENNKKLITALCFLLSEDDRYESELKYSFKKGLIIRGVSGLGKTFIPRCLAQNGLNPIHILSMLEISDEIRSSGEYQINRGQCTKVYLDDVGTEEPVILHYGTRISFFKNFIEAYYLQNPGSFGNMILSTNNNFAEIEQKYGFRVRSRMREMFNVIDVTGKDMR